MKRILFIFAIPFLSVLKENTISIPYSKVIDVNPILYSNQLTFPDEGTSWTAPEELAKRALIAEEELSNKNKFKSLHEKVFKYKDYNRIDSGIARDGNKYWTFFKNDKRLFTNHIIGSGSGSVHILSMTDGFNWAQGDIAFVTPGTYGNFQCGFQNLTGITVVNNGGVVIFNAALYCKNLLNTTITGTGYSGDPYGFKFGAAPTDNSRISFGGNCTTSTWDHFEALGNTAGGNFLVFDTQNGVTLAYDGVNNSTKLLFGCTFQFFKLHKELQVSACFKGGFSNVCDSNTFDHFILDSMRNYNVISHDGWYRNTISYWTVNQCSGAAANDIGLFILHGTGTIHHLIRTGQNWGWVVRFFVNGLMTTSDFLYYSNINTGNIAYGNVEIRMDTTNYSTRWVNVTPHLEGSNAYILQNTCGNMKNQSNYVTPVLLNYFWPDLGHGWQSYVVNNLRYHSTNASGLNDTQNVVFFGPGNAPKVSGNVFYVDPIASNILQDTTTRFMPTSNSPVNGTGNPAYLSKTPLDFTGNAYKNPPVKGGVEFAPGVQTCVGCLSGRKLR